MDLILREQLSKENIFYNRELLCKFFLEVLGASFAMFGESTFNKSLKDSSKVNFFVSNDVEDVLTYDEEEQIEKLCECKIFYLNSTEFPFSNNKMID